MTTEKDWPPPEHPSVVPAPADQTRYRRLTVNLTLTVDVEDDQHCGRLIGQALAQIAGDTRFLDGQWPNGRGRFLDVGTRFQPEVVTVEHSFTNSYLESKPKPTEDDITGQRWADG